MRKRRWRYLLLLIVVSAPLLARPGLIGGDEPHYAVMAWSLAFDGDLDLADDYEAVERERSTAAGVRNVGKALDRHVLTRAAGVVPSHPIGLPLIAAPLLRLAAAAGVGGLPDGVLLGLSLLVTFSGLIAFASSLGAWLGDARVAWLVGAVTFFSSPLWYYGRTFFTEPFVWSFAALAAWLLVRSRPLEAGLLLGLAIVVKEPALVVVAPLLAGAFWFRGMRFGLLAALGPALGILGFLARNKLLYGESAVSFFQPFRLGDPLLGLLGTLLSPRSGLLPFFPLALVGLIGLFRAGSRADRRLAVLAGSAIALQLGLTASWTDPSGGSCFGPRLLVPVLPALAIGLGIAWKRWIGSRAFRAAVTTLAGVGFGVQIAAVSNPFRAFWSISVGELVCGEPGRFAVALLGSTAFAGWVWRELRAGPGAGTGNQPTPDAKLPADG